MYNKKHAIHNELSYYRLSLLSYLKESHPHLITDTQLIHTRGDAACEAYSQAIKDGLSHIEAEEIANRTLYRGLLFSKHDMIVNVLWNEFPDLIPQSEAKKYAQKILSQCEFLFQSYLLSDTFASSPEYDKLYTDLVGFVYLWLEEHEL